jgi:hypothetical protein
MLPLAAGLAIGQGVMGLAQTILGGSAAHKAQKQMEGMVNNYQPNQSIMDYYSKALNRYNVNPYNSNLYQMQSNNIQRGTASGINALQDRRSALAGVSSLVQGQNDGLLKAAAAAEGQQGQALNQLGQATGMKAQEDSKKFDMKYNLLAMKAGGNNQTMNAGIQNMFGGMGGLANMGSAGLLGGSSGGGGGRSQSMTQIGSNSDGSPHFGYR